MGVAFSGLVAGRRDGVFQPRPVTLKRVTAPAKPVIGTDKTRSFIVLSVLMTAFVCVIVAASVWRLGSRPARVDAAHLSIVVLPFTSLTDEPNQDYFADGITEALTTDLSQKYMEVLLFL